RLKTRGPDDAAKRLSEIVSWYREVQAAGGPREYYKDAEGTLQGCGTPGGLGVDCEFFESVMVPTVMLDGFLGFEPTPGGLRIEPRLPAAWRELTVDRIHLGGRVVMVRATTDTIELTCMHGTGDAPLEITLPSRPWRAELVGADGSVIRELPDAGGKTPCVIGSEWSEGVMVRLTRQG
ncbi:MAG: hypothetical protein JXO22_06065, partial [Phycisphaerae bacterium]|nr:hypothetical protein [Phycisphaerae bacterium]